MWVSVSTQYQNNTSVEPVRLSKGGASASKFVVMKIVVLRNANYSNAILITYVGVSL